MQRLAGLLRDIGEILSREKVNVTATRSQSRQQVARMAFTVEVASIAALNKTLKSKHKLVIDGGYGKLKGKAFRISNMGDETDETIAALIKALDSALAELGVK